MIGLDTNVLVRYLVRDDEAQYRAARALIARASRDEERLFVNVVVLCELVWVLHRAYRIARTDIAATLRLILATRQIIVEDQALVRAAIAAYEAGSGDFADHIIGLRNLAAGCRETATFDRKLGPAEPFKLISG